MIKLDPSSSNTYHAIVFAHLQQPFFWLSRTFWLSDKIKDVPGYKYKASEWHSRNPTYGT
jgi:hypothetical protein